MLAVPMELSGGRDGLFLYRVASGGFQSIGEIDHDELFSSVSHSGTVRRAYHIGDYLYAFSDAGISITDLSSLQTAATVPLAQ
jgi:uncharacterized secreted protein with C-terminal beta-propeller domain